MSGAGPACNSWVTSGSLCEGVGGGPLGWGFSVLTRLGTLKGKKKGRTVRGGAGVGRIKGALGFLKMSRGPLRGQFSAVRWQRAFRDGAGHPLVPPPCVPPLGSCSGSSRAEGVTEPEGAWLSREWAGHWRGGAGRAALG